MKKIERKIFTISNLSISLIGVLYFIFKYFFKTQTGFGQRPHELTASFLHLHIISVPILVVLFGYLLPVHILPKLRNSKSSRKKSGLFILTLMILMTITGYLLQVNLKSNNIIAISHIVISGLWIIGYLWHFRLRTWSCLPVL